MSRPLAVMGFSFFLTLIFIQQSDSVVLACCFGAFTLLIFLISLFVKSLREQRVLPVAALSALSACILFVVTILYSYQPSLITVENARIKAEIIDVPSEFDNEYILKTQEINGEDFDVKIRILTDKLTDAQPYDYVEFVGNIYVLGNDDLEIHKNYRSDGVYLGAYTFHDFKITESTDKPLNYHIIKLKNSIITSIFERLPGDEGSIVSSILLGGRNNLSNNIYNNLKQTGVAHLFAASGLHLSIWAYSVYRFIDFLFKRFRFGRYVASAITVVAVLLFTALTGFTYSCLRASIMLLVVLLGNFLNEEADSLNSLGLALLIICVINPFASYNIGLQLSVCSVLGIIILHPYLYSLLKAEKIKYSFLSFLIRYIYSAFSVSFSATVFTLPVSILSLGSISLVSPLTNLLLFFVPAMIMICGGFIFLTSTIPFLSEIFAFIAGIGAKYILYVTGLFVKIPFSCVSAQETYIKIWLVCSLLILALCMFIFKRKGKIIKFTSIISAVILVFGIFSFYVVNSGRTKVTALDVGNGISVLVTKKDFCMLIGSDGDYDAYYEIRKQLNNEMIKEIDLLLLPYEKALTSDSTLNLLKEYKVSTVVCSDKDVFCDFLNGVINKLRNSDTEISDSLCKMNIVNAVRDMTKVYSGIYLSCSMTDNLTCVYFQADYTSFTVSFNPNDSYCNVDESWINSDVLITRAAIPTELSHDYFGHVIISDSRPSTIDVAQEYNVKANKVSVTCSLGSVQINSKGSSYYSVRRL